MVVPHKLRGDSLATRDEGCVQDDERPRASLSLVKGPCPKTCTTSQRPSGMKRQPAHLQPDHHEAVEARCDNLFELCHTTDDNLIHGVDEPCFILMVPVDIQVTI